MHAVVHLADVQERDGRILVLATLFGLYPFLKKLFAEGGYQGRNPARHWPSCGLSWPSKSSNVRIPRRALRFLPRRCVVERTFAWLNRCRRLAKDFENRTRNALALIRLAYIRLMLRKLSNSNG